MPTYSIQGPDGNIYSIDGPEGATREQVINAIQLRMMSQEPARAPAPAPVPVAPPPPSGGFFPALARGAIQTQSLIADILPAMVGKAIGAEDYAAQQFKEAAEKEELIQRKYAAAVPSYKDIKGVGDFVTYITESVGELVPSILPSLVTGGAAGIVGRGAVIAAKEAAEAAARKGVAQGLATDAIEEAAKQAGLKAAANTAMKYEAVGAVSGSALQNIPDVYKNIKDETGQDSLGAALLFGGFNSLLDAALPIATLAKIKKAGIPGEEVMGEWYKRFGKGAVKGFATEGATEAAQEMSSAAAEKFVDENKDFFTEKNLERFLNAGLKGGLGGGVVSGSTDVMLGKKKPTQDELIKQLLPGETLEQGINRIYGDLTANRAFLNELHAQQAEEGKTLLDNDALKAMGFKKDDPLYPAIVDKDLNNPDQATEVIDILKAALGDRKATEQQKTLYADSLSVLEPYLSTRGEPSVETVTEGGGAGVPVAGVPSVRAAAPGAGVLEPSRMALAPEVVGQPPVGAPVVPAPVTPSLKAPLVEAPVEAPKVEAPVEAPKAPVAPEPVIPTTADLIKTQEERVGRITQDFQTLLQHQINRYGLKDVAVNVVSDLKDANGTYSNGLIKLAIDADDPVRDLRHEAIHAMKELGVFTPAQWTTLAKMASDKWVDEHLKGRGISGAPLQEGEQSRHDAYRDLYSKRGMSDAQIQEALVEEAIADAFGGFAQTKAPPGFLTAILNRMRNFFRAIKETMGMAPPETAEQIFGKVAEGKLAPREKAAPEVPKAEEVKSSLRAHRDLFDKAEEIPMSEGVGVVRDNWIGGVSGIGDRDSMYQMYRIQGGKEYTKQVQDFIRQNLGETFKGYRLMSKDELEELQAGAMGSQFASFSLNPKVARAFKNLPRYAKRNDLALVEMDLTPEHVHMIGHPGEQELVVDYGQGYNPSEVKVLDDFGKSVEEKPSIRAPKEDLDRSLVDKKETPITSLAENQVIKNVAKHLPLSKKMFDSTSLGLQTGKSGKDQFIKNDIGGIPEIISYLERRRIASGLPVLDIANEKDRATLANLMSAEAMASIDAGGAALEWYDETIAKTIAMAALKYPDLAKDLNQQMAFKLATSVASQGMNVEDNLTFAMRQFDYFRRNQRFEEIGTGTDAKAMKANYTLANKMFDKYGLEQTRKFLATPFTVEELRSAGFEIGGELGDEVVLGSSIFGPKIGFGFYSNLDGNFEPVTMDMWFMRLIGRLTGKLRLLDENLLATQLDRFRNSFNETGENGVYADEVKDEFLEKARANKEDAIELARAVNSAFNSDFRSSRELYDQGARVKTEFVSAAQRILNSVDFPKDAPQNGTERRQLRDVVNRTVKQIEEVLGRRIPPASLQALVWYPEQELYSALGAKLRVTSQDYAGAMRKILKGEGYGTEQLDRAADDGARQVRAMARKPAREEAGRVGAKPGVAYGEKERQAFLEERQLERVTEQEREKPRRHKVVFEVAPDPNNKALVDAWRALPNDDRLKISDKVTRQLLPKIMETFGGAGRVASQVGSYLDDTNPSFALYLDKGDPVEISKYLGYILGQDSMMVISPRPAPGLSKVGAVIVDINTQDAVKVNEIYQRLHQIRVGEEQPIQGQSTINGKMVVLNYSNLSTDELATLVAKELAGAYDVATTEVYSAFPEKDSYDYSNPEADPRGKKGALRGSARTLRGEATNLLAKELGTETKPAEVERLSIRAPQTEEFKRWFGKSKIVNADGTPKVMYHGTARDITTFKPKQANAIFLTANPKFASGFSDMSADWMAKHYQDFLTPKQIQQANIVAAQEIRKTYKNKPDIRNKMLADLKAGNVTGEVEDFVFNAYKALMPTGPNVMRLFVRSENPFDYENQRDVTKLINKIKEDLVGNTIFLSDGVMARIKDIPAMIKEGSWKVIEQEDVQNAIRSLGFDGFYVKENGIKNFAVYDSSQIKSATGNVGAYGQRPISKEEASRFGLTEEEASKAQKEGDIRFSIRAPKTQEFEEFFEGSKAKTKEGDPLLYYRGAVRDPAMLRPKVAGAIFFSPDPRFAEGYVQHKLKELAENPGQFLSAPEIRDAVRQLRQYVYDTYGRQSKSAKDMLYEITEVEDQGKRTGVYKFRGELGDVWRGDESNFGLLENKMQTGRNLAPSFINVQNPFDYEDKKQVAKVINKLITSDLAGDKMEELGLFKSGQTFEDQEKIIKDYYRDKIASGDWKIIETPEVQEVIRDLKHDGFYVAEDHTDGATKNLAVYSNKQVKSAIGNVGAYGQRPVTEEEAKGAGLTKEEAAKAQEEGDIRFSLRTVQEVIDDGIERMVASAKKSRLKDLNERYMVGLARADSSLRKIEDGIERRLLDVGVSKDRKEDGSSELDDIVYGKILPAVNARLRLSEKAELPKEKLSLRNQVGPNITRRMLQTTTLREQKGFVERITGALKDPEARSKFRAQALNRYNRLSEYDKMKLERAGGMDLYADVTAESAALQSDLSAGILASAFGVHDKVGGVPVYVKTYIVQKRIAGPNGLDSFTQIRAPGGAGFDNLSDAQATAQKFGGEVREAGYMSVSNKGGTVQGPIAIFAPLAKYNDPDIYRLYQLWAGIKRGSKYMSVQQPDGSYIVKEQLFNDPNDAAYAKQLEKQFPEFKSIQEEWIKYNDGLIDMMRDAGVLSAERAKIYKQHGDYIPFYRQINGAEDAVGPRIFQSIGNVQAPKKLKHGADPLGDFLENVVRNSEAAIQASVKNIAARRAADVGMDVGTVAKLGAASNDPNAFYVMENGEKVYYNSSDILFTEAIKSLGLPNVPFIGLLASPANVLRNLVTKDPGFMLANMMRDSLAAWGTTDIKMTPIASTFVNFGKALANKSPELRALQGYGALGGYDYSQNVKDSAVQFEKELRKKAGAATTKEKVLKPVTYIWEALEKGTEASDAATRIEVYKKTLEKTGNEAEALFRALEVMNFNRKGANPIVRVATAAIPFLNARMQGLDVLYRAGFGENATKSAKDIQKAFFIRGATMMALSSMYWLLTHDDDDYKKQEQETRDNNWLIPSLGVKVPIPFELGVMFKVIPERILELTFGQDTVKDFTKSMARQLSSTLAFNPIPQAALPIVEYMTNYSFFTGRPIVGQGMENVAPAYQSGPGTSRVAQIIGETTKGMPSYLQLSPMKIDQLINGYTGTMGMYMVDLMDAVYDMHSDSPKPSKRFEQLPVFKRFLVDPEARGQVTSYYDLKNSVDEATRTENLLQRSMKFEEYGEYMKDNVKMFAVKSYVLDLEKTMKQYNEMKLMIRNSKMDADAKRDALLNIQRAENQLTQNIQMLKKQID